MIVRVLLALLRGRCPCRSCHNGWVNDDYPCRQCVPLGEFPGIAVSDRVIASAYGMPIHHLQICTKINGTRERSHANHPR